MLFSREQIADKWTSQEGGTNPNLSEQVKHIKQLILSKSDSIAVDGLYSSTVTARKQMLWDDYQQIFLDFGMTVDKKA